MKIAVTYEEGLVGQHFGHTEEFKIYQILNGTIISSNILKSDGAGHSALVTRLAEENVDLLICGGIGGGAQNALNEVGIALLAGVEGNVDKVIDLYLKDELLGSASANCSHHDNKEEHTCGEHGCNGGCSH